MSAYPDDANETRVSYDSLLALLETIFHRCGMSLTDAHLVGETLALADLRGVHSHGVLRVPEYVAKLTREGVDPKGQPRIVKDVGAALVIDGDNAMGQVGSAFAMNQAIERAGATGIAAATLGGSNHCGAMAYYTLMALERGMIGVAMTNALPTMAPWGGLDKIVGINPISFSIPTATCPPIVLDTAFAGSAHGKIRVYEQKGLPIPDSWAFDSEGLPTTDATAALDGLLQPIGGFKGIGLAVCVGALSTLLSGASYGTELGNMVDGPTPGSDGQLFLAINVGAFQPYAAFTERSDRLVAQIQQSRRANATPSLYAPGGLEHECAERYRANGIPLNETTLSGVDTACREVGVTNTLA